MRWMLSKRVAKGIGRSTRYLLLQGANRGHGVIFGGKTQRWAIAPWMANSCVWVTGSL